MINTKLCNRVVELEHEIELLKKLNLSYKKQEQTLDELYRELDGGKYETNTKKQTSKRRLL